MTSHADLDGTTPAANQPCTCDTTTGECYRATWHVRPEPSIPTANNRHERRKRESMNRRSTR